MVAQVPWSLPILYAAPIRLQSHRLFRRVCYSLRCHRNRAGMERAGTVPRVLGRPSVCGVGSTSRSVCHFSTREFSTRITVVSCKSRCHTVVWAFLGSILWRFSDTNRSDRRPATSESRCLQFCANNNCSSSGGGLLYGYWRGGPAESRCSGKPELLSIGKPDNPGLHSWFCSVLSH